MAAQHRGSRAARCVNPYGLTAVLLGVARHRGEVGSTKSADLWLQSKCCGDDLALRDLAAVSYTHLDVYKRQLMGLKYCQRVKIIS